MDMQTMYYEVVSIDGDYANLKRTDIQSEDQKLVARALLPELRELLAADFRAVELDGTPRQSRET